MTPRLGRPLKEAWVRERSARAYAFRNELRAAHGQPVGEPVGEIDEAAEISFDWDPIIEDPGMSRYEGSNGSIRVFDTFETQARFGARVLTCKRMICPVQANAAAIKIVHMPLSNANAPHAAMLHDGTSLAFEDVEQQAKIPAIRHDQAKSHPCVRYFVDLLEGVGQLGHRRQNIAY